MTGRVVRGNITGVYLRGTETPYWHDDEKCSHFKMLKWYEVIESTCEEPGLGQYVCRKCGEVESNEVEPARGHDFDRRLTVRLPSCTEPGRILHWCRRCGKQVVEEPEALGHNLRYENVREMPTCTDTGFGSAVCQGCGKRYDNEELPALGHLWVDGEVIRPPTCQEPGEREVICRRCNAVETREIPKLPHRYVEKELQNGQYDLTTGVSIKSSTIKIYCKNCGEVYKNLTYGGRLPNRS